MSQNGQMCNKSRRLYIICSKYPLPAGTKTLYVEELNRRIKNGWADLNHAVIERAVGEWLQNLRAYIRAGGGHFVHMM